MGIKQFPFIYSRIIQYSSLFKCGYINPWSNFSTRLWPSKPNVYSLPSALHCHQTRSYNSDMAVTAVLRRGEIKLPVLDNCQSQHCEEVNGINSAFNSVVLSSALCLQRGGVIAVPTDTIYGVACLAQNTEAVNRIYEIKNRNFQNPVAISVYTIDDIYRWSRVTVSKEILMDLLPGPVTVVFERSPDLNQALNPQTNLVGVRIPSHKFIRELAKECNGPIALTSANISGASSCLQVEEFEILWTSLDLVVNGGKLSDSEESRLGSTVVDLSVLGTFRIIRPGSAYKVTRNCLQEKHGLKEISSVAPSR